jgi:hypothetical protein
VNTVEDTFRDYLVRTLFQVPCRTSFLASALDLSLSRTYWQLVESEVFRQNDTTRTSAEIQGTSALMVATFIVALAIETDCPDNIVARPVTVRGKDLELSASNDNSA